jgi:hypothetical protein
MGSEGCEWRDRYVVALARAIVVRTLELQDCHRSVCGPFARSCIGCGIRKILLTIRSGTAQHSLVKCWRHAVLIGK